LKKRDISWKSMRAGVCPGEIETVELLAGLHRVLAERLLADRDTPAFARATRDGYAVRSADVAEVPVGLEVTGEVKAGDWPAPESCSVGRGQAVANHDRSASASGR
jgi:molybdopterin molybdotransferase